MIPYYDSVMTHRYDSSRLTVEDGLLDVARIEHLPIVY